MAMWFRTLFDTLLARSSRTRARKSPLAPSFRRRSRSARPLLEFLEDRTLLSTYVVDSLTDTGTGSGRAGDLRYCITNATSGSDTIAFAQGLTGAITLESALPTLNASVFIQGPGADKLTVIPGYDTQPPYPPTIFSVGSTANVQISGLTLSNGTDAEDGVPTIANAGTLTVSACTIDDTYHQLVENNGTMILSDCTISGNSDIYDLIENFDGALTVSHCTLTGNSTFSNNPLFYKSGLVYNSGEAATLTVSYSTFSGNSGYCIVNSSGSATVSHSSFSENRDHLISNSSGGAIFTYGATTISNSTIADNWSIGESAYSSMSGPYYAATSVSGGGIYVGSGTLSINSSTITGNEAVGGSTAGLGNIVGPAGNGLGAGLYIAGGAVSINNSTLADNQAIGGAATLAGMGGAGDGGGIYNAAGRGALQMYDTILADNSASTAGPDLDGSITSLGHNLIGNSTGGSGFAASDLRNVNPQLGPLQDNGGPTQTMALLPGSPAIDAGHNANAPAYDQRGYPRIVGGTIDIGAFEVQPTQLSFSITGFPASITAGGAGTFAVTAVNADGSTDTNYTGKVHFTSSDPKAGLPTNYTFTSADAGVHTFTARLKTAGSQTITATDTANKSVIGTESGIVVTPAAAASLVVAGFPSPITAGVAGKFTVTLEDAYGNIASGYGGTVHFSSSDAKAVLPSDYTFTAADAGVHTFRATLKTAGTQSITATDAVRSSLTGTDGPITVNPAKASKFVISAPSSVTPGVAFGLTLAVEDAYGNIVTGYTGTVHLTSSDAGASLPADYTFTGADAGVHTFAGLVLRKKGKQKITTTDTLNSSLNASVVVDVL
jgi:hypothetical protein